MDTSGYYPQLSDDDPLFEIADYTQLMKSKLSKDADNTLVFKNGGYNWPAGLLIADAGPLTVDMSATVASQMTNPTPAFCTGGSVTGTLKFLEAGVYTIQWITAPSGNPGEQGLRVEMYGTWPGSPSSVAHKVIGQGLKYNNNIYWENMVQTRSFRVPTVGLEVRFVGQQQSAATVVSQIFVTKNASI